MSDPKNQVPVRMVTVKTAETGCHVPISAAAAREMMLDLDPLTSGMGDLSRDIACLKQLGAAMLSIACRRGKGVDPDLAASVVRAVLNCASRRNVAELEGCNLAGRIADADGTHVEPVRS